MQQLVRRRRRASGTARREPSSRASSKNHIDERASTVRRPVGCPGSQRAVLEEAAWLSSSTTRDWGEPGVLRTCNLPSNAPGVRETGRKKVKVMYRRRRVQPFSRTEGRLDDLQASLAIGV